jgi:FtsP/CotA-like multicopper oxidase with cupredoxin domain
VISRGAWRSVAVLQTPRGRILIGLSVALVVAAVSVLVGATSLFSSPGPTDGSSGNTNDGGSGNVKGFTVYVTDLGFNNQTGLTLTVKKGDHVRITFVHAEDYGDFHPILLNGYSAFANVVPGGEAVMDFTADTAGTFGFFCTNHDCHIHDKLQGGTLVVQG